MLHRQTQNLENVLRSLAGNVRVKMMHLTFSTKARNETARCYVL